MRYENKTYCSYGEWISWRQGKKPPKVSVVEHGSQRYTTSIVPLSARGLWHTEPRSRQCTQDNPPQIPSWVICVPCLFAVTLAHFAAVPSLAFIPAKACNSRTGQPWSTPSSTFPNLSIPFFLLSPSKERYTILSSLSNSLFHSQN